MIKTNQQLLLERGYVVYSSANANQVGENWRPGPGVFLAMSKGESVPDDLVLRVIAETNVEDFRAQGEGFEEPWPWPYYYRVVAE